MQFILLVLVVLSSITKKGDIVAKMASHAMFQYNVLAIDDTHNTRTNICVKMIIIRFIGLRDEKIKDLKETKSKRSKQRQFAITG